MDYDYGKKTMKDFIQLAIAAVLATIVVISIGVLVYKYYSAHIWLPM